MRLFVCMIFCCLSLSLWAQRPSRTVVATPDTQDSIPARRPAAGLRADAPATTAPPDSLGRSIRYAADPLESRIEYEARDSMRMDVTQNIIYLYGDAVVKYGTMELKADYIQFDKANDLVTAEGMRDSLGRMSGLPDFKDGEQSFRAHQIKYNFKTEKGLVHHVTTQENDLYIHSGKTKYVKGKGHGHAANDVVFSHNSLFTTCNHEHPHFGIRSNKQKLITDKLIVTGPANLEIAGVATPLWLPFGFFPLSKDNRTGLIFPADFDNSPALGFGLRGVGYYWAFSEQMDLQLTGNIYTRGPWNVNARTRYNTKYKYNGELSASYGWLYQNEKVGEIGRDVIKNFEFRWRHNQDRAANPYHTISANINFEIENSRKVNNNDFDNVFRNSVGSVVKFNRPMKGGMLFTAALNHSQVISTRQFNIKFPDLAFTVNRTQPFKRKVQTGPERWYEKIGIRYTSKALMEVRTRDTLLFTPQVLDDVRYGIQQAADLDATYKLLKHINVTPNVSYSENWFFEQISKSYNTTQTIVVDTIFDPATQEAIGLDTTIISSSKVDTTNFNGFSPLRQFNMSLNLNTNVYATMGFKKGWLKGIRYTAQPSLGFSYTPDYTEDGWGYVQSYEQNNQRVQYSRFEGNVFGANPSRQGMQMNLNYGINNQLEIKHFSKKDTVKNVALLKLIDNFRLGGSYNFAADSLNFSPVSGSTNFNFFKNITRVQLSLRFDPYILGERGQRINTTLWETEGKLLRFDNLSTNINTDINWNHIKKWLGIDERDKAQGANKASNGSRGASPRAGATEVNYGNRFLTDVTFSHQIRFVTNKDGTNTQTHQVRLRGNINLSPKWNFIIQNVTYDLLKRSLVYPTVAVSRDLHCWHMGMSWQPDRGTYSFFLKVKPGSLDFINVPWDRNQFDAQLNSRL